MCLIVINSFLSDVMSEYGEKGSLLKNNLTISLTPFIQLDSYF